MIFTILFIVDLIVLAGYCNGSMDRIKKYNLDKDSWCNKWKWILGRQVPEINTWYYFGIFAPKFKESFPYSSTIFVFLTDKWHFNKWLMFLCYELIPPIIVYHFMPFPIYWFVIVVVASKSLRGFSFNAKYNSKL